MAKYMHRIFEMFESRDEAVRALTPKFEVADMETAVSESWTLRHLTVSRIGRITHVEFQGATDFGDETINDLREDFAQLSNRLDMDSKVSMDFTGVASFNPASIRVLTEFHEKLRTKGSRMVLSSLDPSARSCFFADRGAPRRG